MESFERNNSDMYRAAEQPAAERDFELGGYPVALQVALVTDLGPNNEGVFGPADETELVASQELINDLAKPEYSKPASDCWICVDGRCSAEELAAAEAGERAEADAQIGGSLPVSESAANYFDDPSQHQPLSVNVAEKTQAAVHDGLRVKVHGDDHNGKNGCAANAKMRDVIRFGVANADIILPIAWDLSKVAKLDDVLTQDDLASAVLSARAASENDLLWDVSPAEVVDIVVANGGEYYELIGQHNEKATRADMSSGAFDKAKFVLDHKVEATEIQAFSASFGAYAKLTLERAEKHGISRRDAALQIARVYLYNIALTKKLKNDAMPVGVLAPVS